MTRNIKCMTISLTVLSTLVVVSCSSKYAAYSR